MKTVPTAIQQRLDADFEAMFGALLPPIAPPVSLEQAASVAGSESAMSDYLSERGIAA